VRGFLDHLCWMRLLRTKRLTLPMWDPGFVEDFCRPIGDARITRYLGDGLPWDRERAVARHREVLAHWREHGFGWRGIFDTDADDGRLIGIAALQRLRAPVAGIEEPAIDMYADVRTGAGNARRCP
jgi:RimJ/RimL family protein N-acetyltransferase